MDPSELIVGFLDTERAGGVEWTAADFTEKVGLYFAQHRIPGNCRITDEQLDRVRTRLGALVHQWGTLPAGQTLELRFERVPET